MFGSLQGFCIISAKAHKLSVSEIFLFHVQQIQQVIDIRLSNEREKN